MINVLKYFIIKHRMGFLKVGNFKISILKFCLRGCINQQI